MTRFWLVENEYILMEPWVQILSTAHAFKISSVLTFCDFVWFCVLLQNTLALRALQILSSSKNLLKLIYTKLH